MRMRICYFRCYWPSNLLFVVRCVTYISNLRKIVQKPWSLSRAMCTSDVQMDGQTDRQTLKWQWDHKNGQTVRCTDAHKNDFIICRCYAVAMGHISSPNTIHVMYTLSNWFEPRLPPPTIPIDSCLIQSPGVMHVFCKLWCRISVLPTQIRPALSWPFSWMMLGLTFEYLFDNLAVRRACLCSVVSCF